MSQVDKVAILEKLGMNIRRLRQERNMSQEELAFNVNSARNFIGCIERAEKSSSIITLCRIAKAFDVSIEELVKGIDT
ncbi:helix-turn-helix transcriptional regulator [bacterium]|nr:helix-turn-helix transcriptional regulator [bacterium]